MATPIDGQFGSKFPAICDHCGVMTAWNRKNCKFCEQLLCFLEKRPCIIKFSKFCSESLHGYTNWCCTWQKICLPLKLSPLCASRPKSARPAPTMCSQCSRFHPNRFTFGRVIAERVNTVFCPVEYFHNSPKAMFRFGRMISGLYYVQSGVVVVVAIVLLVGVQLYLRDDGVQTRMWDNSRRQKRGAM